MDFFDVKIHLGPCSRRRCHDGCPTAVVGSLGVVTPAALTEGIVEVGASGCILDGVAVRAGRSRGGGCWGVESAGSGMRIKNSTNTAALFSDGTH